MKAYVLSTGILFGLLVVAHIWRFIEEGTGLAKDPWFIFTTAAGTVLCLWAWRVLRLSRRS